MGGPEWVRVDLTVVEKFGADAAVVLALIEFRCHLTGEWEAERCEVVEETRLTDARVKSALRVLRDAGAVSSRRADRFHARLTWTVFAGQSVKGESPFSCGVDDTVPVRGESAIPSLEEVEELPLEVPVAAKPKRTRRTATRIPEDFRPDPAHFALAADLGVDLQREGPLFMDYWLSTGKTKVDWPATLRVWIRNSAKRAAERAAPVIPMRPAEDTPADAAYLATLPPPRTSAFG